MRFLKVFHSNGLLFVGGGGGGAGMVFVLRRALEA